MFDTLSTIEEPICHISTKKTRSITFNGGPSKMEIYLALANNFKAKDSFRNVSGHTANRKQLWSMSIL